MMGRLLRVGIVLGVTTLHLFLSSILIERSNPDPDASDQGALMWMAELSRGDLYPSQTDGVRHPLFSWMVQGLYSADKEAFFRRGKWANAFLGAGFLLGLGALLWRRLDPLALANTLLLSSLGILLVRGTYFQPEPVFYLLFTVCCWLGWLVLGRPRAWLLVVLGAACAVAFLAKPSLTPFLGAFMVGGGVRGVLLAVQRKWTVAGWLRVMAGLAGAGFLFILMTLPLARSGAQYFGKPFFSYTHYWMWMDDFHTEAWPWQDAHPGKAQLEMVAEFPSAATYFRKHTPAEALARLTSGSREVAWRFLFPEPKVPAKHFLFRPRHKKWEQPILHRGIYLLALAALALGLAFANRDKWPEWTGSAAFWARSAYVLSGIVAYVLLVGWYWPIGRGDRFLGALWIPLILLAVIQSRNLGRESGRAGRAVYFSVHGAIALSLSVQLIALATFFARGMALTTRN